MWKGKKILLGISGGIAAYKIPILIRLLKKKGAETKVVITENGLQFITLLTLETVSQNKIYCDMFAPTNEYSTEHISLTDWADMMILAPATANIIGKLANGIADDALSTSLLAFDKDLFICPAMNNKMYAHPSFQQNFQKLSKDGFHFIEPTIGNLACGYDGRGRMEEPEEIIRHIETFYSQKQLLAGKTVLLTAGPTYEKIDAVRFIGNHSSGLMGFSIAEALAQYGANVILVAGPTSLEIENQNITRHDVVSAQEMFNLCTEIFPRCNAAILSAAVADFTPTEANNRKIKKSDQKLLIELVPTLDILAHLGKVKTSNQILVGFALETDHEFENAKEKLVSKNLDFIVLNSLNDQGACFGTPTNKITILDKSGEVRNFDLKSKKEVAFDIVKKLITKING